MGCGILTSELVRGIVYKNVPFGELKKDSGIFEFYSDGRLSIGISYEDIEKYEGELLRDVYIFNVFIDGEYVNIEGEFVRDKDGNLVDSAGLLEDGFQVVADAWNKAVLELGVFSLRDGLESVRNLLDKGFCLRYDLGFEHNGQWIQNPFYDETLRFSVDPVGYYGEEKIRPFVAELLLEAMRLEKGMDSEGPSFVTFEKCSEVVDLALETVVGEGELNGSGCFLLNSFEVDGEQLNLYVDICLVTNEEGNPYYFVYYSVDYPNGGNLANDWQSTSGMDVDELKKMVYAFANDDFHDFTRYLRKAMGKDVDTVLRNAVEQSGSHGGSGKAVDKDCSKD